MRGIWTRFLLAPAFAAAPLAAEATVRITVDLTSQVMGVESSSGSYSFPISSARDGYVTPTGTYAVQSLELMHRSKKYHNSPMPHAIFFYYGYAIHGTYDVANLGRPASHGCVRISPANAATLYALVQKEGGTIEITGAAPSDAASGLATNAPVRRGGATMRVREQSDNPFARIFGFSH